MGNETEKEKKSGGLPGRLPVMALIFGILLVRGHGRLIHAELWAEDGSIFLRDALQAPLSSVLMPYAGYLQVVTRMLALGVSFLPLEWIPHAIVLASYGLFSAIVSAIVGEEYAWLIPTRRARVLCAVLLCFAPGLNEILGNMTNVHWLLFFWLCLLSLRGWSFAYRGIHFAGAGIAAFSTPCGLLLIPVFAHRALAAFRKGRGRRLVLQDVALAGLLAASLLPFLAYVLLAPQDVVGPPKPRDPGTLLALYLHGICRSYFLYPWMGRSISVVPFSWLPLASISLVLTAAAIVSTFAAARRWSLEERGFLLLLTSIPAFIPLLFVTRDQPVGFFLSASFWWQSRYAFISVAVGILGWTALLSRWEATRGWRHALAVFFILSVSGMAVGPGIPAHGQDGRWAAAVPAVRGFLARGEPETVRVPLYPDGWFMVLRSAPDAPGPSRRGIAEAQGAQGSR